jgi:sugar lactone lactonase YvrE
MIDGSAVRVAVQANTEIGESPSWDDRAGVLRFVDAHPGTVYRYDPADGSLTSCTVGQAVGAVVVRESGGIVAAVRDGVGLVDESTGALDLIAPIELDAPGNRMNDGKCDPAGRLWAGTMALDLTPGAGSLYRILPDHSVTSVVTGVTCSNGLGWSPGGDRMYYIDTFAGGIDVFDFEVETGEALNRRRLASVTPTEVPDGLAVDSEGHIWVAVFGDACIRRYTPDGQLADRLELPGRQPTSVAFGGDDLGDLYITTATIRFGAEQHDHPDAGATLVCRPGVTGTPVYAFGG